MPSQNEMRWYSPFLGVFFNSPFYNSNFEPMGFEITFCEAKVSSSFYVIEADFEVNRSFIEVCLK